MRNITLIAAIGKNRELGKNNKLIWSIPEDLRFFKDNTIGKYIVMGINTLNSLPKLLSDRKYIVLTHREVELDSEILVVHSIEDLLEYTDTLNEEVMIIGGASIYGQMIDYADKMLLTEIDDIADADVYFPKFEMDEWDKEIIGYHQYNNINYNHAVYTRKKVK